MEQQTLKPATKGRPRKYFFCDLIVGGTQEYRGKLANQAIITSAASAYSKKHMNGEGRFSVTSGTIGDIKVVTVTRTA